MDLAYAITSEVVSISNENIYNTGSLYSVSFSSDLSPEDGNTLVYDAGLNEWTYTEGCASGPKGPTGPTGASSSLTGPIGMAISPHGLSSTRDVVTDSLS